MEWYTLEGDPNNQCSFLQNDASYCTYARIRLPGGYSESTANHLICNLKIPVGVRVSNPSRWLHKVRATRQFASELKDLLIGAADLNVPICFLPTSKKSDDPDYDPRWDMVAEALRNSEPRFRIETPFEVITSTEAYHSSGQTRNPSTIKQNLQWTGFDNNDFEEIVLIDDVLTTGAHFVAARALIQENLEHPVNVSGVFWAKHQHPVIDPLVEFDDLSEL